VGNYGYMDIRSGKEKGPMKLYVGSLHFNITEDMLKGIFEPFGKISQVQLMTDSETGRSKGFAFITVRSKPPSFSSSGIHHLRVWFSLSVRRGRGCEEGAGADERLRVGGPRYEGEPRNGPR
jgi:hypothetical protein